MTKLIARQKFKRKEKDDQESARDRERVIYFSKYLRERCEGGDVKFGQIVTAARMQDKKRGDCLRKLKEIMESDMPPPSDLEDSFKKECPPNIMRAITPVLYVLSGRQRAPPITV